MRIETITCENWDEYKNIIMKHPDDNKKFVKGKYLYRGQSSSEWSLNTTFDRWNNYDRKDKARISKELLDRFIKECEHEDIPNYVRDDRDLMLSLGQHYGLPTRLLDWSESPYVAAFFAFSGFIRQGVSLEKFVAIWVLEANNPIWHRDNGCEIINVPNFANERIRNQHGKFTKMNSPFDCLEDFVTYYNSDEIGLWKYLVPVRDAYEAMNDLSAMGLSHSRIYPGISGNANAAAVGLRLQMKK